MFLCNAGNPALPHAPTGVTLQPGDSALQVEWAPVVGATSYNVYTSTSQTGPYTYAATSTEAYESRARVAATNGTPVWVVIIASASAVGNSVPSVELSAVASVALPTTTSVSTVAQATPGVVRVTWPLVADAINYRLYRRLPSTGVVLITMTALGTYDDTGLTSGSSYTYYVESENAVGRGAWSTPSTVVAP